VGYLFPYISNFVSLLLFILCFMNILSV
jgi:hypothetical protein